ncbi:MAG: FAD-dependent oxidoreductase [Mucilaginibacter polytrichastri]|nr:FAD-dependent oxidoreductase [Mucilaginibacter polytrichastri]
MPKAIIIGGGIIGLSSAYYLQKDGWDVTVLERGDLSDSASFGNAGMIVPSHFVPLAAPGIIGQGLRWLLDSKSPFYVRPSLNPALAAWGYRFVRKATRRHVEESAAPLRDLSLLSKHLYEELSHELGDFGLEEKGILMLYKSEKAGEEEAHLAEKAQALGLDAVVLGRQEAAALQPQLQLDVLGAVHYRCDAHVYPNRLISRLVKHLESAGVRIVRNAEVNAIEKKQGEISSVSAGGKTYSGDVYVIAGGSWSPALARMSGLHLNMMPGKGYSFMVDEAQNRLQIPALLCEARVSVTPMNGQIRFGGTMEIDAVNTRINMNRVQGIVESIPKYFPDLQPVLPPKEKIWYGFRPCSPDGLPYIGRSKKISNAIVAGGHGMMGLSLGPATGKLVSEIAGEKKTAIGIGAFKVER